MTTQYIYDAAGFLTGVYEGPDVQPNSTALEPIYTPGFTPQFLNGAWVDHAAPPKVGPIAFKLLFTSAERIKAKQLRATDAVLEDFWGLLDDPRTSEVDMGLASVQGAIEYTLAAVNAAGVAVDIPVRKAAILTGVVQ